jgi:hypothetical protein
MPDIALLVELLQLAGDLTHCGRSGPWRRVRARRKSDGSLSGLNVLDDLALNVIKLTGASGRLRTSSTLLPSRLQLKLFRQLYWIEIGEDICRCPVIVRSTKQAVQ